jgi:hypothetical protein
MYEFAQMAIDSAPLLIPRAKAQRGRRLPGLSRAAMGSRLATSAGRYEP